MTATTADRVRKIIVRQFGVDPSVVKDDTHFRNHLGDSGLERLEIEMQIEDEFGIKFDDHNFEYETVGELIALVERKLQKKAA